MEAPFDRGSNRRLLLLRAVPFLYSRRPMVLNAIDSGVGKSPVEAGARVHIKICF